MTISVQSAKAKGRNLQKWAAAQVSKLLDIPWGREDDDLIQSRPMGQIGTDVILRGEAKKRFKFDIECKAQESWNMSGFINQARKNTLEGREWLLILKKKFQEPIVCLEAHTFFKLLEKLEFYIEQEKWDDKGTYN